MCCVSLYFTSLSTYVYIYIYIVQEIAKLKDFIYALSRNTRIFVVVADYTVVIILALVTCASSSPINTDAEPISSIKKDPSYVRQHENKISLPSSKSPASKFAETKSDLIEFIKNVQKIDTDKITSIVSAINGLANEDKVTTEDTVTNILKNSENYDTKDANSGVIDTQSVIKNKINLKDDNDKSSFKTSSSSSFELGDLTAKAIETILSVLTNPEDSTDSNLDTPLKSITSVLTPTEQQSVDVDNLLYKIDGVLKSNPDVDRSRLMNGLKTILAGASNDDVVSDGKLLFSCIYLDLIHHTLIKYITFYKPS